MVNYIMENEGQDDDIVGVYADVSSTPPLLSSIVERIQTDLEACDLKISLLVAALNSYKKDFVSRPFPPFFIHEGEKNFQEAERVISHIPPLSSLVNNPRESLHSDVSTLLSWLLYDSRSFTLKSLPVSDNWDRLSGLSGGVQDTPPPTHLVEIIWREKAEAKWKSLKKDKSTLYAYHGSPLHNFHSILHLGLQQHLSQKCVFGSGTYLHSELLVSLFYALSGNGWENSVLGSSLSVVALCEIIDHPSVKCKLSDDKAGSSRSASSGVGDEVPEKYFIVTNNDFVRVKYMLIYGKKQTKVPDGRVLRVLREHSFTLLMLSYAIILVAVGIFNSPFTVRWLKKMFGYKR